MKAKYFLIATAAFAAIYIMRCTGAVAPKNEGTTQSVDTSSSTATTTKTATTTSSSTASTTETETETAAALGEISETTNELTDFDPKSAYATYTSASKAYSINITTSALTEDSLKVVKSYTCTACDGANDPNCATTSTAKQITISFLGTLNGTAVESTGFPKTDTINKTGATDGTGVSLSFGTDTGTGTITFATGGRPTSETATFDFDLKYVNKDGKKYDAVIKGKGITFPTQTVTQPTCASGEYAKASY